MRTVKAQPSIFEGVHQALKRGAFETAINAVIQHDTGRPRVRPEFRGYANHAWYCAGDAHFRLGNLREAKAAFRRSIALEPEDAEALLALANTQCQLQELRLAIRTYTKALKKLNSYPETRRRQLHDRLRFNLANVLADTGDLGQARRIYEELSESQATTIKRLAKAALKGLGYELGVRSLLLPEKSRET